MAPSAAAATSVPDDSTSGTVQLLLRNFDSRTTVIRAHREDTLDSVLHRLFGKVAGVAGLRILHAGRDLPCGATIGELGLPRDATLHVSSRLRSTAHPQAWSLATEIANVARLAPSSWSLESLVRKFLNLLVVIEPGSSVMAVLADHLEIFVHSGAPVVLVQQYLSPPQRTEAERAIRCIMAPDRIFKGFTAPVLLEVCRSMFAAGEPKDDHGHDMLYTDLRRVVAKALSDPGWASARWLDVSRQWVAELVNRFAVDMARAVMEDISGATNCGFPASTEVATTTRNLFRFKIFWSVLLELELGLDEKDTPQLPWRATLSETLVSLLRSVDECMVRFETTSMPPMWTISPDSVWEILAVLDAWSSEQDARWLLRRALRATLAEHAAAVTALVLSAGREVMRMDGRWITRHRDLLPFEARRHLAMAVLPEIVTGVHAPPPYEMLIDRSQLLPESFGYIARVTPRELPAGMSVAFMHEEAAGPGVLREWFCLVCQALFNPSLGLFSACPHDRRRFLIHPSSAVDTLNLQYFDFAGRMVALALMHKIYVGVFFDRTLFLHLAGRHITLDDIADADPSLHTSCKKILEMDPNLVDSNMLGLTFVRDVEVLGSRTVTELIPGGKDIAVTSQNRRYYLDLLIQDRFVNSTRCQLNHFTTGFSCIFGNGTLWRKFFGSLDATDFDLMLGGSSKDNIDVKEWRAYTGYRGYKEKDPQIKWFWEAVENMTVEQQRRLLFFWTSVKYLPSDGFSGLGISKLLILRTSTSRNHLPTSQTCFYHLNIPAYTSFSMMQRQLLMIVQEHVSSGFGAS